MILILFITLLFTQQSFGQHQAMLIQTFSETGSFSSQVSGIGNVNGDDYDDIMVRGQSKTYIYYGGDPMDNIADVILNVGGPFSGAGDVNNDGYDDVIVGGDGIAYLYYGSDQMDNTVDQTFEPTGGTYSFGFSVAGVGDVNNDSYDDIIIGDPFYTGWDGDYIYDLGRAYIYFGGSPTMDNYPDVKLYGEIEYGEFGFSVAGAGDFNYDTYDDVIVGAPGYYPHRTGRAYIFYGRSTPIMDANPDLILEGIEYSEFGYSIAGAGDVNYNGHDDVIVGIPGYNLSYPPTGNGRVNVYYGEFANASPDVIIIGEDYAHLGRSVSGAGNVNKDLYYDVIAGESSYNSNTGRVSLYFGYMDDMDHIADVIIEGDVPGENFGISVSGAGDVDNDGKDDVIVGADGKAHVYSIEKPCVGSYVLISQSMVDDFYSSGCRIVTGSLTIQGSDITNLDGLSRLKSIGGALSFRDNDNLINISGLSELTSIGGPLVIEKNPALISINGLASLNSVGSWLVIRENDHLTSVSGLSKLTSIEDNLQISNNSVLEIIDGLSSLTSVGGPLQISNNDELISIAGLSGLISIEGLSISNNIALPNIDALSGLESVRFSVEIGDNNELSNISLPGLTSLEYNLVISGNNVLTTIDLSSLNSIGGDLLIKENNALNSIAGLSGLISIEGSLEIVNNSALTNIDALSSLESVGLTGSIWGNDELINLGLSSLTSIGLDLLIHDNGLTNIDGLSSLMMVGRDLSVQWNTNLTRCCGLYQLLKFGTIGGLKVLSGNGGGCTETDILAGTYCNCDGDIYLYSQEDVDKFASIGCSEIGGTLRVRGSDITNLNGLEGLTLIGAFLNISNNAVLSDINGLSSLTSVGGDLIIENNAAIMNIDGLSSLTSVGGWLEIIGNESLKNINGLSALSSYITKLNIVDNPDLNNIDGLSGLSAVGKEWILIKNNDALTDIDGLLRIASVEGSVVITDNEMLENIDGLSSLMLVGKNLEINNNNNLVQCCGAYPLLEFGAIGGPIIDITNNGSGCTEEDIQSGGHCHSCDENFVLSSQAEVDNFYTTDCAVLDGSLTIQGANIANLDALTFLTSVSGDLYIINNPLLTNLDGFINLSSVGGDVIIYNNPILTDLDGLSVSSLTSVGENLEITNNVALTNLDGLSSLTYIGGDLIITNNEKLTNFGGLYPVLNAGGVTGSITIEGNGKNPDAVEILFVGLNEKIEQSYNAGLLNIGQSNALRKKLGGAIQSLNRGNTKAAINKLNAFINQVNAFINSGILTQTEGQELISTVKEIIGQINTGNFAKIYGLNDSQEITEMKPEYYSLDQNYPNPFNPVTEIIFALPEDTDISLKVFDILGREVANLASGKWNAGIHRVFFNASESPSGIYIYKLNAGDFVDVKKMILMK